MSKYHDALAAQERTAAAGKGRRKPGVIPDRPNVPSRPYAEPVAGSLVHRASGQPSGLLHREGPYDMRRTT